MRSLCPGIMLVNRGLPAGPRKADGSPRSAASLVAFSAQRGARQTQRLTGMHNLQAELGEWRANRKIELQSRPCGWRATRGNSLQEARPPALSARTARSNRA